MLQINGKHVNGRCVSWIKGIDKDTFQAIVDYLDDEVTNYMQSGKWFSLRDIGGGDRFDWTGTPLYPLYDVHIQAGENKTTAIKKAGWACGKILRRVIMQREENFEQKNIKHIANYRWMK